MKISRTHAVLLIFIFLLVAVLSFKNTHIFAENIKSPEKVAVKQIPTPTLTPTPTVKPQIPQLVEEQVIIAPVAFSDSRTDELFDAMNTYRQARGLSVVSKSNTLCSIAQARANENQVRGSLSHDGFTNYVNNQTEFATMSEVLFWADFQAAGNYMVNEGWDKSPAHNQAINDPIWRSGCGGVAGNFAAFEFGA